MVEILVIAMCLLSILLGVGGIKASAGRFKDNNFEYCRNENKATCIEDDYKFRTQK